MNKAFTITTRAGNAVIRTSVPPFTWWRGLRARELLENYFTARVKERREASGPATADDCCARPKATTATGSPTPTSSTMIFLMMAAHDTSTINGHDDESLPAGRPPGMA